MAWHRRMHRWSPRPPHTRNVVFDHVIVLPAKELRCRAAKQFVNFLGLRCARVVNAGTHYIQQDKKTADKNKIRWKEQGIVPAQITKKQYVQVFCKRVARMYLLKIECSLYLNSCTSSLDSSDTSFAVRS